MINVQMYNNISGGTFSTDIMTWI